MKTRIEQNEPNDPVPATNPEPRQGWPPTRQQANRAPGGTPSEASSAAMNW